MAQMFVQRVIGLEQGAIVFDGTPEELTADVLTHARRKLERKPSEYAVVARVLAMSTSSCIARSRSRACSSRRAVVAAMVCRGVPRWAAVACPPA